MRLASVKTNVGHTICAAGVTGLIKVLLSLHNKQLPPSLNYEQGNPNIEFADSPFYVNTELREWQANVNDEGEVLRRCAVVSSFGFSGTNAHMVIEEAPKVEREAKERAGYLVVLSARTETQLREQVEQLRAHCEKHSELLCSDISYTLLLGRKHFNHRLSCVVRNLEELVEKLTRWLEKGKATQVYVSTLTEGESREQVALKKVGDQCIEESRECTDSRRYLEQLATIAELYMQGYGLSYERLFERGEAGRIPLPSYPFARERYWVEDDAGEEGRVKRLSDTVAKVLHPLLHENTSTLSEQSFRSVFSGEEFFLKDHVVMGERVLPGVAYLEMARAAVTQALGLEDAAMLELSQVAWLQPLSVGESQQAVHISLVPETEGRVAYQIYSLNDEQRILHSQGWVVTSTEASMPRLPLDEIRARCAQRTLPPAFCYEHLQGMGIVHGPSHQGIKRLHVGSEEVLAELVLPEDVLGSESDYVLHPSMLDSALQASLALLFAELGEGEALPAALPFALESVRVYGRCERRMWAHLRYSAGSGVGEGVQKLDIDLCDAEGVVCVSMQGFSSRVLTPLATEVKDEIKPAEFLLLEPIWQQRNVAAVEGLNVATERVLVLCGVAVDTKAFEAAVAETLSGSRVYVIPTAIESDITSHYIDSVNALLPILQDCINGQQEPGVLLQVLVAAGGAGQSMSGLSGLLRSAEQESRHLSAQLISVDGEVSSETLLEWVQSNSKCIQDKAVRYQSSERYVLDWDEVSVEDASPGWKAGGVYVISGGAGGLGLLFAREIALQSKDVHLVLTGRSILNESQQESVEELVSLGASVVYRQVDVSVRAEVESLLNDLVTEYGFVTGVVHSAGVIADNYLVNKTVDEVTSVLAPKVTGLVNLDEASSELNLELFAVFSSLAGVFGNVGQADYAAGNAFMDEYMAYRRDLVSQGIRTGASVSINWPLWRAGGMQLDEATEQMMLSRTGMQVLETEAGIAAFYQVLSSMATQVMVLPGEKHELEEKLLGVGSQVVNTAGTDVVQSVDFDDVSKDELQGKIAAELAEIISALLKFNVDDVDIDVELSDFGFDSISLTQFGNSLNEQYQLSLTPTIFFEYPSIKRFAGYLATEHTDFFMEKFSVIKRNMENPPAKLPDVGCLDKKQTNNRQTRFLPSASHSFVKQSTGGLEPVAVIGMSGRFPMSEDLDAFWENLLTGKDCISEIPKSRWDWEALWGDPKTEENKTNIKWGGFIEGIEEFDSLFFGISPREAQVMDPQQRLFMSYAVKAIEDAGYSAASLSGSNMAVFAGTAASGYLDLIGQADIAIEGYSSTGASTSIGPNRVSYFFDVHGPSEPIETACSSSLVAIHRAQVAIDKSNCDMAIAGGVNLLVTPSGFIAFNKAGMLSPDGRCKTFSAQANGYVRGEGVGVLVLKRLSLAEQDNDHIYGVIIGSAENHGGRANSLTAPNPKAQADLLKDVYTQIGIDPRTIGYIEAHGTGTELGDPVEIDGLKSAFNYLYEKTLSSSVLSKVANAHCGIASVKTNIGHLELASGVVGVIKVLLQLKHKTLVKSLHSEEVNPYIQLDGTPFYIVQESQPWPALETDSGKVLPRRAGINSFGFGGVNAHVVLEEYLAVEHLEKPVTDGPYIILLSAKNEARLRERVNQLLQLLEGQAGKPAPYTEQDLADIAFTLQVGRDAMEFRLGLVVNSMEELLAKLKAFSAGEDRIDGGYHGKIKRGRDALDIFLDEQELQEVIDKWLQRGKYNKLVELWVKGLVFDWSRLYGDLKPRRLSLPSYPFSKEHHWVSIAENCDEMEKGKGRVTDSLHPLVHVNTSTLSEQRFSTVFSGEEFFLKDHVVMGERILPGVAYLEMVRAAVKEAAELDEITTFIEIENVSWIRPLRVAGENVTAHVGLYPDKGNGMTYEIYSEDEQGGSTLHSQGRVCLHEHPASFDKRDRKTIEERCKRTSLSSSEVYAAYENLGLNYGPSHQGLKELYVGEGEVLAELLLPESVGESLSGYMLHPSLLDSGLQAALGLLFDSGDETGELRPALPFALESLKVYGKCRREMWAHLRYSTGSGAGESVQKLDIDLCDDRGVVLVAMRGFSSRVLPALQTAVREEESATEVLLLKPCWQSTVPTGVEDVNVLAERVIVLCGVEVDTTAFETAVKNELEGASVHVLPMTAETDLTSQYVSCVTALLPIVQECLNTQTKGGVLLQVLVPSKGVYQSFAGISGLLRSAEQESRQLSTQLMGLDGEVTSEDLLERVQENGLRSEDKAVRYQAGERYVLDWEEQSVDEEVLPWKAGGVYLISGGAGGLGLLFARELALHSEGVQLVLTGRSALSESQQASVDELISLGASVVYRQLDVAERSEVDALFSELVSEYGEVKGIVHSAGVIADNYLMKKTAKEMEGVLAPKVGGLVNLDEVSREMELELFVVFSSLAGAFGNVGQGDYAAGNGFMDAYMAYRRGLVESGERCGLSVSINWPLWRAGGMQLDAATEQMMLRRTGMEVLETELGLATFHQVLSTAATQIMVMPGDVGLIKSFLKRKTEPAKAEDKKEKVTTKQASTYDQEQLNSKSLDYFKELVAQAINVSKDEIDITEPLDQYGVDSILATQIINTLNESLDLNTTVLFEYQTIEELIAYLIENQTEGLLALVGLKNDKPGIPDKKKFDSSVLSITSDVKSNRNKGRRFYRDAVNNLNRGAGSESRDIAIIGLSGRFPGAEDIDQFWSLLKSADCAITEIPKSRWDGDAQYDPDPVSGKVYSKWGGFLENVDHFAPAFFGVSPTEANMIDPQERLFLEMSWNALEDAGYARRDEKSRKVGVFVGATTASYYLLALEEQAKGNAVFANSSFSLIANRVSYYFDFDGPSLSVDTISSSALTAIHMAVESLRLEECEMALAGGVNLYLHPSKYVTLCFMRMLSKDAHIRSFAEGGTGWVPGEGVGAVLLKPLHAAERDGDKVYAVIKGTAANHRGRSSGLVAPKPSAYEDVMNKALLDAGFGAETVSYLELQGSGSEIADASEFEGVNATFGDSLRAYERSCVIGTVEPNIGHLEAASGMAQLTKVLLQMKHKQLLPFAGVGTINPKLNIASSPFGFAHKCIKWSTPVIEKDGKAYPCPRRAGINSIGASGAGAHLLLEEYCAAELPMQDNEQQVIVLSARTEAELGRYAAVLLEYIKHNQDEASLTLHNIAHTLQLGREAMEQRLAIVVSDLQQLITNLEDYCNNNVNSDVVYVGSVDEQHKKEKYLQSLSANNEPGKVAEYWSVKGNVDWRSLYATRKAHKISLPCYPFIKQSCWLF